MCEEQKEHYLEELNRLGKDEIADLPKPNPLNENDPVCSSTIIRNVLANCLYNWSQRSCKHGLSDVTFLNSMIAIREKTRQAHIKVQL